MLSGIAQIPGITSCYRWRATNYPLHVHGSTVASTVRPSPCHRPACPRPSRIQAASAESDVANDKASSAELLACEVAVPERRYQQPLVTKQCKVHKAKAEALAKQNQLVKFQLGAQGFSTSFLTGCINALLRHEVIRVKLGGFTKDELAQASQLLEQKLDCVVVYQIGHTLTLYRERGLPRPSNLPPLPSVLPEQFEYADELAKQAKHSTAEQKQQRQQMRKERAARDAAAAAKLPPEFKVL